MSNYYLFASLISWIFPSKEDAQKFRHFCKDLDNRKKVNLIHSRYSENLKRLKNKYKNEKIKIVFLNDTPAKWQYQALYDELKNNPDFEVEILVTVYVDNTKKKKNKFVNYKQDAENCYNFFSKNNMPVKYAFDFENEKPIDLKEFNPDIIFYGQPWGIFKKQNIEETSKYALCCYSSYGACISNGKSEYGSAFFKYIFKYFVDNEYIKFVLNEHGAQENSIIVSGHPKLDAYLTPAKNNIWKSNDKKHIIYAPHFSFHKDAGMHLGTFDRNYDFFLNYAKEHQEYEFIFKPHPRLKEDIVIHNLMTQKERDDYYNQWATLPNTQLVESGNYMDIFKTSDLLITDCNSFLFEYLPSEKPLIQLISEKSVGHNLFGQKILAGYYKAKNNEETKDLIEQLLVKNIDQLKEKRLNLLQSGIQPKEGYAKFVAKHLIEEITKEQ